MSALCNFIATSGGTPHVAKMTTHPIQNGSYSVTARLTGAAFFLSDGRTGRKNGRESQEETPDAGSYRLGDNARDH